MQRHLDQAFSAATLREKVIGGLLWVGTMRFAAQILTWTITICVIRLLAPADYGVLAMAMVMVSFLGLFAEAGLGQALVQAPQLDQLSLRRAFGAVIVVNCALAAVCFLASNSIAHFFGEERLVFVVRVLSLQFVIGIFAVIPTALLTRVLDFKRLAMIGLGGSVLGSLATLLLAMHGYGVWALIAGALATNFFNAIALNVIVPFLAWPLFSISGARKLLIFGGQVTGTRLLWYLYSQSDLLIAGKLLGKDALGFYSIAMHIASLPVQKTTAILNQVTFPAFSRSQNRPEATAQYVLKGVRLVSVVSIPTLWGISSVAPEIIELLLGHKWAQATLPLQLLPLIMPLTMLGPFFATVLQAIGRSDAAFSNVLIAVIVMPMAFYIGSHWGLLGLSLAWVSAFPIVFLINLRRMLPLFGLSFAQVSRALGLPALAGLAMYAAVVTARWLAEPYLPDAVLAVALILLGASVYLTVSWLTNKAIFREMLGALPSRWRIDSKVHR